MPNLGVAQLTVARRDHRSVVTRQFGQAPLQVHRPLYLEDADYPVVYLRTPSSGLLDGDVHEIRVQVEPNATLELRTQAATLVYPGKSQLTINLQVGSNARLIYRPHPIILAAGAELKQSVHIEIEESSKLNYRENWCAGRIAMQECWRFSSFENSLLITGGGVLKYREYWKLQPSTVAVTHPLLCDRYTHFASTFAFGEREPEQEIPADSRSWILQRDNATITRMVWCE